MNDIVNHPSHYGGEDNPYETIKVAEAWGFDKDAYLFNVLKYISRPGKGTYLEDLKKAKFYLDRKIENMLEKPDAAVEAEEAGPRVIAGYTTTVFSYGMSHTSMVLAYDGQTVREFAISALEESRIVTGSFRVYVVANDFERMSPYGYALMNTIPNLSATGIHHIEIFGESD
jgi:hypothetical protein